MAVEACDYSQQCCWCVDCEGLKAIFLCPVCTFAPGRVAIKHRAKRRQILDFKLCLKSSDIDQNDADQQRAKRKNKRPNVWCGTGDYGVR